MRIISGRYGGRALASFKGDAVRPTADRVKESLFDIIFSRVSGARVLDGFCGSGSLGIECISRGAAEVHFNDVSADSIALLKKNLRGIEGNFSITRADFSVCMRGRYDLIFLDPPYASDAGTEALKIIARDNRLTQDGIAIYERDRSFEGDIDGLCLYDERKYGKTYLSFFKGR